MKSNNNFEIDESQPLVSIIVPIYKVEKYISKCMESIINQSYKNIEIIVVDDGTPDMSASIVEKYKTKDSRIKLISQNNLGVASARNHGMREAKGDFITFVDSDDWIAQDYIDTLIEMQRINNSDMCMTTNFFIQKNDLQKNNIKIETISSEAATALLLSPKMVVGSYNKLYRKSWLIDNNIWQNERLYSGEGLNFIVTAAQHANHITVSNKRIYYYRRNVSESATTKFNINMFINNEYSLDLLYQNMVIHSDRINDMLDLFREHLMISGLLAILTYSSSDEYPEEFMRWKKEIKHLGLKLLKKSNVPFKSKFRIIGASVCPKVWAKLAKYKRDKIFRESV